MSDHTERLERIERLADEALDRPPGNLVTNNLVKIRALARGEGDLGTKEITYEVTLTAFEGAEPSAQKVEEAVAAGLRLPDGSVVWAIEKDLWEGAEDEN